MNELVFIIFGTFVILFLSELVLGDKKIQTVVFKLFFAFIVVLGLLIACLATVSTNNLFVFIVLELGVFISWFGIRSHLQNSILLRFTCYLREDSLTKSQLINVYQKNHGLKEKMKELEEAKLIRVDQQFFELTPKGKLVLFIVKIFK